MLINRDVRIIRFEFESLLYERELFENFESVADIIRVLILRLSQIISQNAVFLLIYNILKLNLLVYNILKNEFKTVSNKNRL